MEHIKITCEYCGTSFYPEKSDVCPHCGASYADNPILKKKKQEQEELDRLKAERRKREKEESDLRLQEMRRKNAFMQRNRERSEKINKGCFGILAAIGIAFLIIVAIAVKMGIDEIGAERDKYDTSTIETTTEVEIRQAEGNFGEEVDCGRYSLKIDKIERTEYYPWSGTKGHTCVLIHALLTNHLERSINTDIYAHVIADGIAQKSFILPQGYSDFASILPKGLTAEGWYKFEIPDNAKNMTFEFGDYIDVHFTWDDVS